MRRSLIAALAMYAVASPAAAQAAITAGMPRSEVVATLGAPAAERTSGGLSYLFYASTCEPVCPANDLIVLRDDRVVDAILVSPARVARLSSSAQEGELPDLGEPGALYPPFGDPLLNAAPPLRIRTYVLPGTFEYAEPRQYREIYPGARLP